MMRATLRFLLSRCHKAPRERASAARGGSASPPRVYTLDLLYVEEREREAHLCEGFLLLTSGSGGSRPFLYFALALALSPRSFASFCAPVVYSRFVLSLHRAVGSFCVRIRGGGLLPLALLAFVAHIYTRVQERLAYICVSLLILFGPRVNVWDTDIRGTRRTNCVSLRFMTYMCVYCFRRYTAREARPRGGSFGGFGLRERARGLLTFQRAVRLFGSLFNSSTLIMR